MSSAELQPFEEQEANRYDFLPPDTACILGYWEYQGVHATAHEVGPVMPTVAFNTVDIKLPAQGPAKVIEINGTDSGLYGYKGAVGDLLVRSHLASIYDSLGLPRARFRYMDKRIKDEVLEPHYEEIADGCHPYADIIDLPPGVGRISSVTEGVREHDNPLSVSDSTMVARSILAARAQGRRGHRARERVEAEVIEELSQARALIELNSIIKIDPIMLDDPTTITVNPTQIRLLESDKARFASYCQQIGLDQYRPRFSLLFADAPDYAPENDIRDLPDIEQFVLKLAHEAGGEGVVCLSREEIQALSQRAREEGSWRRAVLLWMENGGSLDDQARKMAETFYFSPSQKMVLEEYIPSKTIESGAGHSYDATMRIATLTLANQGHISAMPLAAYWKLPPRTNVGPNGIITGCSDIAVGGSLPVSDEDFQRAFFDTADLMTQLVYRCRSADGTVYKWPAVTTN